jgi:valyl-tRNA synthetase
MSNTLKLLHPFIPFITEEIWQALPHEGESIMISKFPEYSEQLNFTSDEQEFERIMDVIKAVRNRRAEMNVPPSKKARLYIETQYADTFKNGIAFMQRLASASEVEIGDKFSFETAVQVITSSARVFIPMDELVDKDKELVRLNKEKAAAQKDFDFIAGKLANQGFLAKAPANVVEAEKQKLDGIKERLAKIEESIQALNK